MKYGYIRCNDLGLRESQVNFLLEKEDVDEIFIEEGNKLDFDKYNEMVSNLSVNDEVILLTLDALGNTVQDMKSRWIDIIEDKKADISIIGMPQICSRDNEELLESVLDFFSKREKDKWKERQRIGIANAKSGGKVGRPSIEMPVNFENVYCDVKRGYLSVKEAIKKLGISQSTYYKFVSEYNEPDLPFV